MEGNRSTLITFIATILAFSATAIIMFRVDPFKATAPEKSLFFISVSIGILGIMILIGSVIYKNVHKD